MEEIFFKVSNGRDKDKFWTTYKRFASTEVLMYLIMVIGIAVGIILLS